tara:strand:+ start:10722 stop:10997 length:276 start_codon:yes stop_codon:yes gene_type:complete
METFIKGLFSFITGGAGITWALVWETLKAIIGRITWRVVLERFLTRVLVEALKRLKTLSSNRIVDETVDSILLQLRGDGLLMAKIESSKNK